MKKIYFIVGGIIILVSLIVLVQALLTGNRGSCLGTATPCYNFTDDAFCGGQDGCDYYAGECTGPITVDCSAEGTQGDCELFSPVCEWVGFCEEQGTCEEVVDDFSCTNIGCTWHCGGSPTACSSLVLDSGSCGVTVDDVQFGCYWDNCTYAGSGDWLIYCEDNCNIDTISTLASNKLNIESSGGAGGYVNISANVTVEEMVINKKCQITNKPNDDKFLIIKKDV